MGNTCARCGTARCNFVCSDANFESAQLTAMAVQLSYAAAATIN